MGKPGIALATAETAFNAIGLMALPDIPPYVVRFSWPTAGHPDPSVRNPIRPASNQCQVSKVEKKNGKEGGGAENRIGYTYLKRYWWP